MPNLDDARTISRLKIVVTSQADGVASGLSKIAHSLAEMKSAMKGGFGSTLTKLANQIERLAQALDKIDAKKLSILGKAMKDIRAGGAGNVSIRFTDTAQSAKKMGDNIEKATEAVKEYKNEIRDIIVWSGGMPTVYSRPKASSGGGGGGYVPPIFPGLNPGRSGGGGVAGLLGEGGKGIDISGWFKGGVHFDKFAQFTEFLGSIRFNFGDLSAKLASVKERASGFFQQLKRIAMYRAIRWVLKTITEYISTGVKNLYQYSKIVGTTFAPTMDSLASSALFLKNSLGVVAGQLIESIAPVLIRIVDAIAEINNQIAMTIAYLRGNSTYTKAVKVAQEYDDTLSHIRATLLGFDEINRMDGANGQSGLDYSKMFVEDVVDRGKAAGLLATITLIGEALGLWKLTGFLYDIENAIKLIGSEATMGGLFGAIAKVAKIAIGLTLTVVGIKMAWGDGKIPTEVDDIKRELLGFGGIMAGLTLAAGMTGFYLSCGVALGLMVTKVAVNWGDFEKQLETPKIDSPEEFFLGNFGKALLKAKNEIEGIKTWWTKQVVPWWNEHIVPAFTLEVKFFQKFWNDITDPFSDAWTAFQNLGKLFKRWWEETIKPLFDAINSWWDTNVQPLIDKIESFLGIGNESHESSSGAVHGGGGSHGAGSFVNEDITEKFAAMLEDRQFGIVSYKIFPKYANGGFPEDGLFYANHGEMVGQFSNGKTAVVNNQEITAGIAQAVYQAIVDANGSLTSSPVSVSVEVDGETIARAVAKGSAASGRRAIARG